MPPARRSQFLPPRIRREAAAKLKALAHPARLQIVELLAGGAERNVSDLTDRTKLAQHVVSQHLKELRIVGIVTSRRSGREVYYRLNDTVALHIMRCIQQQHFRGESFQGGEAI